MPRESREQAKVVDIVEKRPLRPARAVRRRGARSYGPRLGWAALVFSALQAVSMLLAGAALYEVRAIERETRAGLDVNRRDFQSIAADVDFQAKRGRLLLRVRDEILKTNSKLALSDAYGFADLVLRASEKYPAVDPLLMVAIGIVESGYDPRATSSANARGLYQIWPATGRLLARSLEWEYSDHMLYDPAKNTELAALYLDVLFAAYRDPRMVLAEYNGGPINAGYLRAGSGRVSPETRDYVLKVIDVHERLKAEFAERSPQSVESLHQDRHRRGKSLAETRAVKTTDTP